MAGLILRKPAVDGDSRDTIFMKDVLRFRIKIDFDASVQ